MDKSFSRFLYDSFLSMYLKSYINRETILKDLIKELQCMDNDINSDIKNILLSETNKNKSRFVNQVSIGSSPKSYKMLNNKIISLYNQYYDKILKLIKDSSDKIINDIIDGYENLSFEDIKTPKKNKVAGDFRNLVIHKDTYPKLSKKWILSKIQIIQNEMLNLYKSTNDLDSSIVNFDKNIKLYNRSYANLRILIRNIYVSSESFTNNAVYDLNKDKLDFIYTSLIENGSRFKLCSDYNTKIINEELNGVYPQIHPNCVHEDSNISFMDSVHSFYCRKTKLNMYEIQHDNGTLKITDKHPVMTSTGWKNAENLQVGDKLTIISNDKNSGDNAKDIFENVETYQDNSDYILEIHENNNFFSEINNISIDNKFYMVYNYGTISNVYICDGVLVHNCNSTSIPTFKLPNGKFFNPKTKSLKEWFDNLNKEQKIDLIGRVNYNRSETGKYNFPQDYFQVLF